MNEVCTPVLSKVVSLDHQRLAVTNEIIVTKPSSQQ